MLCLSRKPGSRVVLRKGDTEIIVTVLAIDRDKVRLGFEADREVAIWRQEIDPKPPQEGPVTS